MKEKFNMKINETYITDCGNLLVITKIFKNGKFYADEISGAGIEGIECVKQEKNKIGQGYPVYGVLDKNSELIINRTSFYDDKAMARAVCKQMNDSITEKSKPYSFKKAYLIIPNL